MSQQDSEFWTRARRARDKLVDQFIGHPDVTLIGIGYAPDHGEETGEVVLRIHVRERWVKAKPEERVAFPEQVEGIPVVVMSGEYQLETGAPAAHEKAINRPDPDSRSDMMTTEETRAASHSDAPGDPEAVGSEETPRRCKAIAKTTGTRCKKMALSGSAYCAVHQDLTREEAEPANPARQPSEERTETTNEGQKTATKKGWEEHAAFSVFFNSQIGEDGERVWQTRVSDDEGHTELEGIDTAKMVTWILDRAGLPPEVTPVPPESVAAEPVPPEAEATPPPARAIQRDVQVEILDADVNQSPTAPDKKLVAEVRFQIAGAGAETLEEQEIPFEILFRTVHRESGAASLVASEQGQLRPQEAEYSGKQEFPIPDLGPFELETLVLLLAPDEPLAFRHREPRFSVVPRRPRGIEWFATDRARATA